MTLCSQAVKTATTDESTDDHRALDLDAAHTVSIPGATLIECDAYTRTDDGAALRFDGSEPLFVVGLCSERKARDALADAGYADDAVDRAFELGEWMEDTRPERATAAIRTAERDEVRAMADGGRELTGDHPLGVRCNNCGEDYRIDETVANDCPACGHIDFEVVDSDPDIATDGGQITLVDTDEELPAIVDLPDDPHRVRCEGCGDTGVKDLDGGPVILHDRECPHAEDSR